MIQSLRHLTWWTLFVVLALTSCAEISKKTGVENRWRDHQIVLQEGVTTQQEVLNWGRHRRSSLCQLKLFSIIYSKKPGVVSCS
jgi:hypothetical protein